MTGLPARRLEDTDQWVNRMEIHSQTSTRKYVVAEKVTGGVPSGTWACSCPGWKRTGRCKHLTTMGLTPMPRAMGTGARAATGSAAFRDSAYQHYDPRAGGGFGTPEDWIAAAAAAAAGRGAYVPPARPGPGRVTGDMQLLGLEEMPADAAGLVRAMRRRARVLHPDVVHPTDNEHRARFPQCPRCDEAAVAFTAMTRAYDRLLRRYR